MDTAPQRGRPGHAARCPFLHQETGGSRPVVCLAQRDLVPVRADFARACCHTGCHVTCTRYVVVHGPTAAQQVADAAGAPLALIEPPAQEEAERLPAPKDGIALLGGLAAVLGVLVLVLSLQVVIGLQQDPRDGAGPEPAAPPFPMVAPTARAAASLPVRLTIPRLTIDAAVEQLGLAPDRTMEVPTRFDTAGWYMLGRRPGERGNAVLAGHLDSKTGPAIFWRLKELQPGDEVIVTGDDGQERRFLVRARETYRYDQVPIKHIFGRSQEIGLNLITCAGAFDRRTQNYEQRLVVYTTLAP